MSKQLPDLAGTSVYSQAVFVGAAAKISGEEAKVRFVETSIRSALTELGVEAGVSAENDLLHGFEAVPAVIAVRGPDQFQRAAKRLFDIGFALALILIFAPFMLLLCAAVRLTSPGPAIFIQQRVGRNGALFPCLKFRTMVVDAAEQLQLLLETDPSAREEWARDQKLRNDIRITSIGGFLRKSSLDELPQLFNILLGQMSVVGPRPIVTSEIPRYGALFSEYCAVRPGLTGPWQIGGRNDVDYATRVRFDGDYARQWSVYGDLAICLKTIPALLQARGCY